MKKALIVGLVLPLASVISFGDAGAVSYVGTPTARPATAARLPSLAGLSGIRTIGTVSVDAGLLATCAEPLKKRFSTSDCVREYEGCLRSGDVCKENFQLCSNIKQFNKKRILCQDELARCPADGIKALFGNSVTTSDDSSVANRAICEEESVVVKRSFSPALQDIAVAGDSPVQMWIKEGNSWASANSVKSCNETADDCIKQACAGSPHKCIDVDGFTNDDANNMVNIVDSSETGLRLNPNIIMNYMKNLGWGSSNVNSYLREQCRETIGSDESCFMVVEGTLAKEADLIDRSSIDRVYRNIMETGVNARFKMNQSRIKEWAATAALASANTCKIAMRNCAVNACGEGSYARCYGLSKDVQSGKVDIKGKAGAGITAQCENVIKNNQSCLDVFVSKGGSPSEAWDKIWIQDSIGAISGLSTELSEMFNEDMVANMRRACQTVAEDCVTNECAPDYTACFISSIDAKNMKSKTVVNGVVTGKAWNGGFDGEMAKGLCLLEVKKDKSCREFFDVEYAKKSSGASADSWGTSSGARNAWLSASSSSSSTLSFCSPNYTYSLGDLPTATVSADAKFIAMCAEQERNIFGTLVADIGTRVQSMFERKANEAKTACKDAGEGYAWTALPNQTDKQGTRRKATEDTFGGACQREATLTILIKNQPVKNIDGCIYSFWGEKNVGLVVGCGEWLTETCLDNIEAKIRESEARSKDEVKKDNARANKVGSLVGVIAGLAGGGLGAWGGYTLGDKIASSGDKKAQKNDEKMREINQCLTNADAVARDLDWCSEKYGKKSKVIAKEPAMCNLDGREFSGYTCEEQSEQSDDDAANTAGKIRGMISALTKDKTAREAGVKSDREKQHKAWGTAGAITLGALGTAGGIWGGVETANAIKEKANQLEKDKQDAAYKEWYDSIGSKIKCRLAGDTTEVGYRVGMEF
ncbi:MAG: hypothetical protein FWE50_02100 [Alphaproteobacteria bacterium]|nr:hypothetical protein [Alphaproteobacteria bacterium]